MKFRNNILGLRIKGVKSLRHKWQLRAMHWVYAPALITLAVSGLYINKPNRNIFFNEMNTARKTHFISQYIFGLALLTRGYYALKTRGYRKLLPDSKDMAALPKFSLYEMYVRKKQPKYPKYNPGQKLLFAFMSILFPLQIITGVGLYSTGKLQKISRLFGGLGFARRTHFLGAVGIMAIISGHMYFAFTESLQKLKSIFTGYFKPE